MILADLLMTSGGLLVGFAARGILLRRFPSKPVREWCATNKNPAFKNYCNNYEAPGCETHLCHTHCQKNCKCGAGDSIG